MMLLKFMTFAFLSLTHFKSWSFMQTQYEVL